MPALLLAFLLTAQGAGAATLREARVAIAFSPAACDVTTRFVVDSAAPSMVEHSVMVDMSADAPAFTVIGAVTGDAITAGRTVRLPISLTGMGRNEYTVRFRLAIDARGGKCPLLVPSVATDGLSRSIAIEVALPSGSMRLPGEFPSFTWSGNHGRVTLGHLPSFVRVPVAPSGAALTWRDRIDSRGILDAAAIVTIIAGTLAWATLRRARA
jgi:hypothetical protein